MNHLSIGLLIGVDTWADGLFYLIPNVVLILILEILELEKEMHQTICSESRPETSKIRILFISTYKVRSYDIQRIIYMSCQNIFIVNCRLEF